MKPSEYRPIILKVIKESTGRFPTVEAFADHLITQMDTYAQMLELAGTLGILPTTLAAAPVQDKPAERGLVIGPDSPAPQQPQVDISERMAAKGLQENFSKTELHQYYNRTLPPQITVNPPGFEQPLVLIKRMQSAPGDLGFVKIAYAPQGIQADEESATVFVETTDADMDASRVLAEIKNKAEMIYRPEVKRIPVMDITPFANASLEGTIRGALSVETDARVNAQDMADWGRSAVTPDVIAKFNR